MKPPRHGKKASRPSRALKGGCKARTVSPTQARRRAARHVLARLVKGATVRDGKDAWLVSLALDPAGNELRASQIIAVCKRTGRVVYEGSSYDEG
jgi:hypothetical protein